MRLFVLDASQIDATWSDYARHFERFERACGDMSAEQVKAAALDARMQIWGIQDDESVQFVAATEVCSTALGNLCVIRIGVGRCRAALQQRLVDEIGKWAGQIGCDRVRIYGRRGWLRRLRQFRETGVIAEWQLRTN